VKKTLVLAFKKVEWKYEMGLVAFWNKHVCKFAGCLALSQLDNVILLFLFLGCFWFGTTAAATCLSDLFFSF
jgi:hypothetical protein